MFDYSILNYVFNTVFIMLNILLETIILIFNPTYLHYAAIICLSIMLAYLM